MNAPIERIVTLERINYEANLAITQITPGLDLLIRDDVIITTSEIFPAPDTNHACMLQATPQTADDLIVEIIDHFESNHIPPTIFISPVCTPTDLPRRLLRHGFVKNEKEEAWLTLDDLLEFKVPAADPKVVIKQITKDDVLDFCHIFMNAFEMPTDFAPYMAQLMEPSVNLPGVYHYLALLDGQPIGTCSLVCYRNFGIFGSTGVISAHRGKKTATNLAIKTIQTAQQQGVDTLILQTTAGTLLERFLRISGFRKVFTRTCYTLS